MAEGRTTIRFNFPIFSGTRSEIPLVFRKRFGTREDLPANHPPSPAPARQALIHANQRREACPNNPNLGGC
jgi:hypothetical protein